MTPSRLITVEEFESEALPHLKCLYQTAAHLIGDRVEAEDLVQQTYLQAWKAFDRFKPGTNCRAWLFQILLNVTRHHRRSWFSRRIVADCQFLEDTLPAEHPLPDHLTDEDVLAALDQVPECFREVLLLIDVQEFSYREAAETLKIPIGTVMSRVSRGRDFLRTQLLRLNNKWSNKGTQPAQAIRVLAPSSEVSPRNDSDPRSNDVSPKVEPIRKVATKL